MKKLLSLLSFALAISSGYSQQPVSKSMPLKHQQKTTTLTVPSFKVPTSLTPINFRENFPNETGGKTFKKIQPVVREVSFMENNLQVELTPKSFITPYANLKKANLVTEINDTLMIFDPGSLSDYLSEMSFSQQLFFNFYLKDGKTYLVRLQLKRHTGSSNGVNLVIKYIGTDGLPYDMFNKSLREREHPPEVGIVQDEIVFVIEPAQRGWTGIIIYQNFSQTKRTWFFKKCIISEL